MPADWGDGNLVWTVTVNGTTYQALGSLWDSWVLDEGVWRANRGAGLSGRYGDQALTNQPPRVAIVGDARLSATVGSALALTATASDDGLPGPQDRRPPGGYDPLPNDLPTIGGTAQRRGQRHRRADGPERGEGAQRVRDRAVRHLGCTTAGPDASPSARW